MKGLRFVLYLLCVADEIRVLGVPLFSNSVIIVWQDDYELVAQLRKECPWPTIYLTY